MKFKLYLGLAFAFFILFSSCSNDTRSGDSKILIFSKTAGYHHECIADGLVAIKALCKENNIQVDTTTNPSFFNEEDLDGYAAVLFFNTTGDVLDSEQETAFERYIQAGGGFIGVHAASDTEYGWPWYGNLAGAYFTSHPKIQKAKFVVQDSSFAATSFLPKEWNRTDELYNLKMVNDKVNVVLTVDESTYEGGTNGDYHPMAWYHEFDGGRSFYTALGHTKESYKEDLFMKHLLEGIKYSIGDNKVLDYSKAKSQYAAQNDRFSKVVLAKGDFYEPTEMTILPNNNVLIAQRRGELMMYNVESKEVSKVGYLDVYHESGVDGVNAEEGFMGLQKDPNFAVNNWIYAYYAPKGSEPVNRLSRFKFTDNKLQMDTEQKILDVASDRQICCHTGGSIAFGPGDVLYLSTGDNSTPFDEPDAKYVNDGFAPLNDLPGKSQYDARRSSANTNDLRGKILRIKVQDDGSYTIPEGNLFPPGTEKTRPEIYTMGHRNPYRISVDPKKGYVYWGDVGPDASEDDWDARGPRGYDEMNQARSAGNYGWPLFIADNQAYKRYDYATGKSGEAFDPMKPINDSKNNTGLVELPAARGAYVYYPYDKSTVFSGVTSGGRNAMAGPTFYADMYPKSISVPQSYDGKVIIYDWMRGWMKAVTLLKDGSFGKMEPFAAGVDLANLIDMEFGPDGKLYLLEYGSGWFSQNYDSGLGYIEYNAGNRAPKVNSISGEQTSGKAPLNVNLTIGATDPEGKSMEYVWDFGNGETKTTTEPNVSYTYTGSGSYQVSVIVKDEEGLETPGEPISIVSGNTRPEVTIDIENGNSSFFLEGKPVEYNVRVSDVEDGANINLDASNVLVTVDYMDGFDEAGLNRGHQSVSDIALGESLTMSNTCKSCHKEDEKSIGPSYVDIAMKYKDDRRAKDNLMTKVIKGGTGVWGENVMPANAEASPEDVKKMVKYILSLAKSDVADMMKPKGTISPEKNQDGKVMVITASYTDKGAEGAGPLTGVAKVALKSNQISVKTAKDLDGFSAMQFDGMDLLLLPKSGGSFSLDNINLSGVSMIMITAGWQDAPSKGITMELRQKSPDGKVLAKGSMATPQAGSQGGAVIFPITQNVDEMIEKLYFVYAPSETEMLSSSENMAMLNVTFNTK